MYCYLNIYPSCENLLQIFQSSRRLGSLCISWNANSILIKIECSSNCLDSKIKIKNKFSQNFKSKNIFFLKLINYIKISVGSNKLHLILLFFIILSIIMTPTVETVFSCLKDAWTFFRRSFIMQFICVIYTNILYIKLAANSCQVFIKLNLWPEAAWWKMAPSNQ